MDEQPYPFREDSAFVYRFESVSTARLIQKVVLITETNRANTFNLALLDELENDELSDTSVSDNEYLTAVVATVFRIAEDFMNRFPNVFVYFSGSDARRTRLYRIAISHELVRLQEKFIILGRRNDEAFPFAPDQKYDGFLIRKKL